MARGTVTWFCDNRGYGFISMEGHGDVFVHHTAIEGRGFRTLSVGDRVECEVQTGERGPEAAHVTRLM
jgi:CspA family cold shock protein